MRKILQDRSRRLRALFGLYRGCDHWRFCLPGSTDDGCRRRIMSDGCQADGDDQPVAGYLYSAEIGCRCRLCLVVGSRKTRDRMNAGSPDVEGNVSVRSDPAQKEPDAAQCADVAFILHAPFVDMVDHFALL